MIAFTDEDGNTWEHELRLVSRGKQGTRSRTPRQRPASVGRSSRSAKPKSAAAAALDFSLRVPAFIKRHATGVSGPRKFTILVARLTKGDLKAEASVSEIERQWSKMTRLLGQFNRAHATRAKDNAWVDSPKTGVYKLLDGWRGALAVD